MNSSESSGSRPTPANGRQVQAASEPASAASPRRAARAELIWEGKYDANGRRTAPLRVALPFQTVETVNESAQERQRGFLFGPGFREEEWRNRLIWGDKKYVLPSLLAEFAGKVNLIYIDPPSTPALTFLSRRECLKIRRQTTTRSRSQRSRASSNTKRTATRGDGV